MNAAEIGTRSNSGRYMLLLTSNKIGKHEIRIHSAISQFFILPFIGSGKLVLTNTAPAK
jgi:hypothetical protein